MSTLFLLLKENIYSKKVTKKEINNLDNYLEDNKKAFETYCLDIMKNFHFVTLKQKDLYSLFPNCEILENTNDTITYKIFFNEITYSKCIMKKNKLSIIGEEKIPLFSAIIQFQYSIEGEFIRINKVDYGNIIKNGIYKLSPIENLGEINDNLELISFLKNTNEKNIQSIIKNIIPKISLLKLQEREIIINFEEDIEMDNKEKVFNILGFISKNYFSEENIDIIYDNNSILNNYIIKIIA